MPNLDDLFFILSKIAWAFLSPGNLIIFFLVIASFLLIFNRIQAAKILLIPTALLSFILMAYPVSDYLMAPLESRFSSPKMLPSEIDGILVLGGGEDLKRSISWQVAELGSGGDRYIGAAMLAKTYPNAPVIFTGGSGSLHLQNTATEGDLSRSLLTAVGIDAERLIIESRARNTDENFKYTKPLLPTYSAESQQAAGTYFLVTSAYHMPRAVGIARQHGVKVIPYPVDYYSNHADLRTFDFDLFDHLKALEPAWREWIGLTAYYFTNRIDDWFPKPE
ncbi:MAG: YdcF family protein [Gammaproteobacteria bacterium]|nr:YdcF family protein [Gammaproteobacteria bacterium]